MGTTLTGTTPQDTYDSLIKVTDNGPLTGSLKKLTDGLGNDSALSLSTGAASIAGTLAVSSTISATNTISVTGADTTGTNVGIVNTSAGGVNYNIFSCGSSGTLAPAGSLAFRDSTIGATRLVITSAGNVGIGTSTPTSAKLVVSGGVTNSIATVSASFAGAGNAVNIGDDGTNGVIGVNNSGSDLVILKRVAGVYSETVRFPSTGGLTFNGDTAAANALDDYEEGTWTPTNAGDATGTLSSTTGTYTKIGNLVTVRGIFTISTNFTSNTIGGLPFTVAGGGTSSIYGGTFAFNDSVNNLVATPNASSTNLLIYTGGDTNAAHSPTITNATFRVSFTYFAS